MAPKDLKDKEVSASQMESQEKAFSTSKEATRKGEFNGSQIRKAL